MRQASMIDDLKETWPEEEERCRLLAARFQRLFRERGVPGTPQLALRLRDMLSAFFLVRRLEQQMLAVRTVREEANAAAGTADTQNAAAREAESSKPSKNFSEPRTKDKDLVEGPRVRAELVLVDAHGKASERWRKAMKELEEYCDSAGRPVNIGLADIMKPIIQRAEKVLKEAEAEAAAEEND